MNGSGFALFQELKNGPCKMYGCNYLSDLGAGDSQVGENARDGGCSKERERKERKVHCSTDKMGG